MDGKSIRMVVTLMLFGLPKEARARSFSIPAAYLLSFIVAGDTCSHRRTALRAIIIAPMSTILADFVSGCGGTTIGTTAAIGEFGDFLRVRIFDRN